MQHDFRGHVLVVVRVAFTPIIADSITEDVAVAVERRGNDWATYFWVALKPMFCVLIPEVKGAIAASRREGAVLGVERDCVDSVDFGHVAIV